jgi:hypothetical protein
LDAQIVAPHPLAHGDRVARAVDNVLEALATLGAAKNTPRTVGGGNIPPVIASVSTGRIAHTKRVAILRLSSRAQACDLV